MFLSKLSYLLLLLFSEEDLVWQKLETDTAPSSRLVHTMVYDAANQNTLLFGGRLFEGGRASDTWILDGKIWKQIEKVGPGPRDGHEMAYCTSGKKVVLFGGNSEGGILEDTWTWDGSKWEKKEVKGPGKRWGHMMVAFNNAVLLFGGKGENMFLNDTWQWDGKKWTLLSVDGPAPRYGPRMAVYKEKVILYGGRDHSGNWFTDTWQWNGSTWKEVTQREDNLPKMSAGHFLVSTGSDKLFLMGGIHKGESFSDIWQWDGTRWIKQAETLPFQLDFGASTYDEKRSSIIITGNINQAAHLETWVANIE